MVERRGEYFYDFLLWGSRIRTHLYQDGFNMVPIVLLGEDKFYGTKIGEEGLKIYIDDYFRVNGEIRRRIREDIRYKINLHHITWSIMRKFEKSLDGFVSAVNSGTLRSSEWLKICEDHVRLLALLEMNFCLPTIWYNEILSELTNASYENSSYTFNDMSYSDVTPFAIQVRKARLELCLKYHNNILTNADCEKYMEKAGFMDNEIDESTESYVNRVMEIVEEICTTTSESDVTSEIETIEIMRKTAKTNYLNKLVSAAREMDCRQYSKEESCNLTLALTIISLAATEEEYRHILQSKFFFHMNNLLNALELPINTSSIQDVSNTLRIKGVRTCVKTQ